MPYYYYKGRLIYFSVWKHHVGMYALTTPILNRYKSELQGLVGPKGAVQLPLDEKLPIPLIKKLVKAKVKENDAAEKKK
jgi:uncharacterized protein YdhG (YjbR/CyaY superfamily)